MSLKDEILRYRARENLSQVDFAARVGLSKTTIVSIELGRQKPTQRTETKIRMLLEEAKNESI